MQVRSQQQAAAVDAWRKKVNRVRIDPRKLPDGGAKVYLTVTLPGGHQFRFCGTCTMEEAATEVRKNPEVGYGLMSEREIGALLADEVGFLGGLWKGIKKAAKGVAKVAKKVATSKVFKVASDVLAKVGPALGPFAPAAMAASTAMKTSTMLLAAKDHAARGTPAGKAAAKKLVEAAGKAAGSAPVMDVAQHTSGKVFAMLLRPA